MIQQKKDAALTKITTIHEPKPNLGHGTTNPLAIGKGTDFDPHLWLGKLIPYHFSIEVEISPVVIVL